MESGSNEKGSWIKFSDGTLLEWGYFDFATEYSGENPISFPLAFMSMPLVYIQNYGAHYGNDAYFAIYQIKEVTTTYFKSLNYDQYYPFAFGKAWLAIGKWK